jgi:ribonuclease HII
MSEKAPIDKPVKPTQPTPDLSHEIALWQDGYQYIGGIDEAGRGCWAGPVFAAVVIFPPGERTNSLLGNVRDSKQMTSRQRQKWADVIKEVCLDWGVGSATSGEIDSLGIVPATRLAARRAVKDLKHSPEYLLLDYLTIQEIPVPQHSFIRGDQRVLSIAAASILAKTSRDDFMLQMDSLHPVYSFRTNRGYGTAAHQQALQQVGICPIHRLSFKPVKTINNSP